MISKLISYIQESRRELERVNWPTRNETIRLTVVVIGMSLAVAFFLGAIDFLFSFLMKSFLL
ncbi:MAG: preprotein translocase subunit SecE [Patescibacteria group bacterium]